MGPTPTGNILVLYGHGGIRNDTFDFRWPNAARINLYSWTREGIPVWDIQIQAAANEALAGTISTSFATVNSSRIGGTSIKLTCRRPARWRYPPCRPAFTPLRSRRWEPRSTTTTPRLPPAR
jgi:hypothetical protein